MQEKPLTPYQKTQLAAAAFLGLAVTGLAGLGWALRARAAAATIGPASIAAGETLCDAVAAPAAPRLLHSTQLELSKSWIAPPVGPASADDLTRERLLASAAKISPARVETLRRQGLAWEAIARRLGWPARSARLFAASGVLVGRPVAARGRKGKDPARLARR